MLQLKKHLVIDSRLIEETEGVALALGKVAKHPSNPLFGEDKPWEVDMNNAYAHVMYDDEEAVFKCWYNPFIVSPPFSEIPEAERGRITYMEALEKTGGVMGREFGLCYAVSKDGLAWEKPELDIYPWDGKPSNILMRKFEWQRSTAEQGPHGCSIIKDAEETDPTRRYKMVASLNRNETWVSSSRDGLTWAKPIRCKELDIEPAYNFIWAPTLGKYVLLSRDFDVRRSLTIPKVRVVMRSESVDAVVWSQPEVVLSIKDRRIQPYCMPVFYHCGIYLGLPAIFDIESDHVYTELAWSPDTVTWYRVCPGTPLIPNSEREGEHDWGCIYSAQNPVFLENEIRLYYAGSDERHYGWRNSFLDVATLRPDGFAGYSTLAADRSGTVLTKPVMSSGTRLYISADVKPGGHIRVSIDGHQSNTIGSCDPITAPVTDTPVVWTGGEPLPKRPVALKFELKKACLYAFGFGE